MERVGKDGTPLGSDLKAPLIPKDSPAGMQEALSGKDLQHEPQIHEKTQIQDNTVLQDGLEILHRYRKQVTQIVIDGLRISLDRCCKAPSQDGSGPAHSQATASAPVPSQGPAMLPELDFASSAQINFYYLFSFL